MGVLTIFFQNKGQDFLEFDLSNGSIVEARPVNDRSWRHFKVLTPENDIKPGAQLSIQNTKRDNAPVMTIKYPIVRVEEHPVCQ